MYVILGANERIYLPKAARELRKESSAEALSLSMILGDFEIELRSNISALNGAQPFITIPSRICELISLPQEIFVKLKFIDRLPKKTQNVFPLGTFIRFKTKIYSEKDSFAVAVPSIWTQFLLTNLSWEIFDVSIIDVVTGKQIGDVFSRWRTFRVNNAVIVYVANDKCKVALNQDVIVELRAATPDKKEQLNKKITLHGHAAGGTISPEYRAWQAMRNRCQKADQETAALVGQVCGRWYDSFELFLADLGFRPSDRHSLGRLNEGMHARGYEPGGVAWQTPEEQAESARMGRETPPKPLVRARSAKSFKNRLYAIWYAIRARCHDATNARYKDYGGRGIVLWQPWRESADEFYKYVVAHLGEQPTREHTIDRINNDKGYEPENLRWATYLEQNKNRRNTRKYEFANKALTLTEWCALANMDYGTVRRRLHYGWALDEALGTKRGNLGRTPGDVRKKWLPPWIND